jgi:WD40 repeat protein
MDTATGKARLELPCREFVQALAIAPDGAVLAAGTTKGALLLLDADSGNEIHRLKVSENVRRFAFSPDGKTLAAGLMDDSVSLWEVTTGKNGCSCPDAPPT